MPLSHYLLLSGITLFAAFVQGLSGFGFTLIVMSFFTIFQPVDESAVLATILVLPIVAVNLYFVREYISFKRVIPVLIAMVIGLPIGILGLVRLSENILLLGLGIFVLATLAVNELSARGKTRNGNVPVAATAGLLSGMFGGAFAVSGPPLVLYFSVTVEEKRTLKACMLLIMLVQVILRLMLFFVSGVAGAGIATTSLILAAPLAAGGLVGAKLFNRVPSAWIRRIVQLLLVVSSAVLIVRAV